MDWFGRKRNAAEGAMHLVQEGVKLASAGHHDRGLAAFDEVLREYPAEAESAARRPVVEALYNKGVLLALLGRRRDAENTLGELVGRFSNDADPAILNTVTRGLFNLAVVLRQGGEHERAIERYRELVQGINDRGDSDLAPLACEALTNLCRLLLESQRNEEALQVANDLFARLGLPFANLPKEERTDALSIGSAALAAVGRDEEALGRIDEALRELRDYTEPGRTERTVLLLLKRGAVLIRLDRLSDATACFDESFRASIGTLEPDAMFYGAKALLNKSSVHAHLGAHRAELETLSIIVQRFAGRPDPRLTRVTASALSRTRVLLKQAGRHQEARAVELRLQTFAAEMREADDDQIVARALMDHARRTERLEDKVQMIDEAVAGLEKHPRSGYEDTTIASAQSTKALALAREGHLGEAIATWDQALERLSGREDDEAEAVFATAQLHRAGALNNLGCDDAALSAFADLVSRFEHRRNARVSAAVIAARDAASQVHRCRLENIAACAPAMTLPDVVALSRQPLPEDHSLAPVPQFLRAQMAQSETELAIQLSYAAHDPRKHAEGETGFALVASLIRRVQQETGRVPSSLIVETRMNVTSSSRPDTNYQLAVENMAVFGLPLHAAMRYTHAGTSVECLQYRLKSAGCVLGTAMGGLFEARGAVES